jgi:hypothetical protein
MKKSITKLILGLCSLILTPVSAQAKYESVEELFKAFGKAGFEQVMEMPASQFSSGGPYIKVHEIDPKGKIHETTLSQYAKGQETRMADLDYVYNNKALLSRAISGKVYAEAYQVGDIFLCYRVQEGFVVGSGNHLGCFMFPTRISEVVQAIRAL